MDWELESKRPIICLNGKAYFHATLQTRSKADRVGEIETFVVLPDGSTFKLNKLTMSQRVSGRMVFKFGGYQVPALVG